ncbi:HD domain-containing protein [Desulfofundulus thermobenzoicus]|uniref:HD domain-containing protein n=1 Tax=Desulfofundulus thermobenzoicus TaxID=29376 RepID=A0A6N7IVG0_9FIRM|nr:HD-GYP domain-containing protein [Desulfofundulus thermobenzoicus]MQL53891.1 HD domain-containing protein [Desulfofundulus thermobenzoicus]
MKSTMIHAARALIHVLEASFKVASQHSQRVASYSLMLARELGMTEKKQKRVYLSGLLHDIGKLGIPSTVLLKPGKLTAPEWEEIKKHPVYSYEILSAIPGMDFISRVALYHHERYDGGGYPEGLAGEAIPLEARILAVADSFDAMTSDRVYRPRMSWEAAVKELYYCAGTQLDPHLVDAFCRGVACGGINPVSTMIAGELMWK